MINADSLFDKLDINSDDVISSNDLNQAANRMDWHWAEAPLYAILHLAALSGSLTRSRFQEIWETSIQDRYGPYGRILESVTETALSIPLNTSRRSAVSPGSHRSATEAWMTELDALSDTVDILGAKGRLRNKITF